MIQLVLTVLVAAHCAGGEMVWSANEKGWASSVAYSPDGASLAVGKSDGTAHVYSLADKKKKPATFTAGERPVSCVAFSPSGRLLAAGSFDGTTHVWDARNQKLRFELAQQRGGILCVAFNPDGLTMATGGIDGDIRIWSTIEGALLARLDGHKSWVNALAFDGHGMLYSGGSDGLVRIWDPQRQFAMKTFDATTAEVRSVAVSQDGHKIAAGIRYGTVKLWVNGVEQISVKAHQGDAWAVAFTPDGSGMISGGGDWKKAGDVKVWKLEGEKSLDSLADTGETMAVAVSPDGNYVASASGDGAVKIWRR